MTKLVFDLTFTELEIRTIPTVFVNQINVCMSLYIYFPIFLNFRYLLARFVRPKFPTNLSTKCCYQCAVSREPTGLETIRVSILFMQLGEAAAASWKATRLIGVRKAQITYATTCGRNRNVGVRFRCHRPLRRQPEKLIEQCVITAENNISTASNASRRYHRIKNIVRA